MTEQEAMEQGKDVTIVLVQKTSTEVVEPDTHTKKRKIERVTEQPGGESSHGAAAEEKVLADSSGLRRCSKYFDTCLSGRWPLRTSSSESPHVEFRLEVQTEPVYYRDCFSRMDFPFLKPIPDVLHCVQLLKVASHIEYHELMEICVKYLSAAPWSKDEEDQIREFCSLGQLSLDATRDLCARLRFPLSEQERKVETEALIQRVLKRYLRIALTIDYSFEPFERRSASRQVFSESFHALVSCSGGTMCHDALQFALSIATNELEKILECMTDPVIQTGWGTLAQTENHLQQFCWLFEVLREANAAQVVVELLLKLDVSQYLVTTFEPYPAGPSRPEIMYQWTRMMYVIFQDVLNGRLFLTTAQRVALYQQWNWILKWVKKLALEELPVSKVVARFIMSFPVAQQEEIYLGWASSLDDYPLQGDYNLSLAHTMWMMTLVGAEVPWLEDKLAAAQSKHNADNVEYLPRVNSRGSWDIL